MNVLFASAECAPFFKVGGLGDVAYALPKELVRQGTDIRVVLPFYAAMPQNYQDHLVDVLNFSIKVGWRNQYCGIKTLQMNGVTYYFIDNQYYFNRPNVYGYSDDGERFAFFNLAICEFMEKIDFIPDVLHVNDWHTAMVPVLLKDKYQWIENYQGIKTLLTIHNLQFQGVYDPLVLAELFGVGMNTWHEAGLKFYDSVNYLKGGIEYSDQLTTVSPSYASEIQTPTYGEHLDGVLRKNSWKLQGILNGIDYELNNPERDPLIPVHFTQDDLCGKVKNKVELQEKLGLPVDERVPILSMVTRLTSQKGCDLVLENLETILERSVQVVILGTGDPRIEDAFRYFAGKYPGKLAVRIQFDADLAQQIYAASDLFLMPSLFEPCGLSQLMALRYGTLPIVHETGGLKDTIFPYNQFTRIGTGFSFSTYTAEVLMQTIDRANALYWDDKATWYSLVKQAMSQDFSWSKSALVYQRVYQQMLTE